MNLTRAERRQFITITVAALAVFVVLQLSADRERT
jgi:hypothetical protein